jgi:hypothetical protein
LLRAIAGPGWRYLIRVQSSRCAGVILGGIQQARAAGKKATINSECVWLYNFDAADLVMQF